jgi:hypothetical protein
LVDGSLVVRLINRGYTASGERLFKNELSVSVLPEPVWSGTMTLQKLRKRYAARSTVRTTNVPSSSGDGFAKVFNRPIQKRLS